MATVVSDIPKQTPNLYSFPLSKEEKKLITEGREKFDSLYPARKAFRFDKNEMIKFQPLLDLMVQQGIIVINPQDILGKATIIIKGDLQIFWAWIEKEDKAAILREPKKEKPVIKVIKFFGNRIWELFLAVGGFLFGKS